MYAQEWLTTLPFAFHVDGGQELRAAVATFAGPILVDAMAAATGHKMTAPRNGGCQVLL